MADYVLFKRGNKKREEFEEKKKTDPESISKEEKLNKSVGKIYYVKFRLKNGKMSTARSTGQTSKTAAEEWVKNELEKTGGNFLSSKKRKILFKDYAKDFFIKDQIYFKDKDCSWRQCLEKNRQLNEFVIPYFGEMILSEIEKTDIDNFRRNLQDKYSGSTINKILNNLRQIFIYAEDQKIISVIPKIQRPPRKTTRPEKGILTLSEVRELFSVQWPNYRAYVANMTAAVTGCRRGELLALRIIDFDTDNKILNICGSFDEIMKERKPVTKNNETRQITVPGIVASHLTNLIKENPYGKRDSYIFYNTSKSDEPIRGEVFTDNLISALKKIGYTKELIKEKNFTFHGWRSFFNTYCAGLGLSTGARMKAIGWNDINMAEKVYSRPELEQVLQVQETIFLKPGKGDIIKLN